MTNAGADTGFRVGLARRKLFPTARISFSNYLAINKLIYIYLLKALCIFCQLTTGKLLLMIMMCQNSKYICVHKLTENNKTIPLKNTHIF